MATYIPFLHARTKSQSSCRNLLCSGVPPYLVNNGIMLFPVQIAKLARDLNGKFRFGTSPVGASGGVSAEAVRPKSQPKRDPLVKPVSDMRAELFGGSDGRQGRNKKKRVEESEEKGDLLRPDEAAGQEQLSDKMGQLGVGEEGGAEGMGEEEGEEDENAYGGMLR